MCGGTGRAAAGGGGGGAGGGATKGVASYLPRLIVPVEYNGAMISAATMTMCNPVAVAHWRGLRRTVFVVGVSSSALRKTSFCVVGDRRILRAGFPTGPAWRASK